MTPLKYTSRRVRSRTPSTWHDHGDFTDEHSAIDDTEAPPILRLHFVD